jgi:fructuronate reductase
LLEVQEVFGALGADPRMRSAVTDALEKLFEVGAREAVRTFQAA